MCCTFYYSFTRLSLFAVVLTRTSDNSLLLLFVAVDVFCTYISHDSTRYFTSFSLYVMSVMWFTVACQVYNMYVMLSCNAQITPSMMYWDEVRGNGNVMCGYERRTISKGNVRSRVKSKRL